ncbi:hypothetical protein HHL16_00220 [Pseudoflavitalea sp. G-6-1-2]|uniref:hypothetical protein n=1 Tax=Pseudoflavitalea sp. G-6-1-2 TaxID=2728841 RepID=UPI00146F91A5|nr:hypothetical protein [Pseudoflavitalea sp. G-6-1-2]NML19269.1 hypothetical protein [Pseudoflavitalea sp. G-6-1-2]
MIAMISLPTFFVLTSEGESVLPDSMQQKITHNRRKDSMLYLDANVCLDLLNYFNGAGLMDDKITNVETLIFFCQHYKISVVPKFGAMELSTNRELKTLDLNKYQDIVNKITYVFDKPLSRSEKLKEWNPPYTVEVNQMDILSFNAFYPLLLISYVTLLELYIICKENNPREANIRQNLERFCHWCEYELNTSMASEILLATRIFGGVSEFRRMVDLDKKTASVNGVLQTIWGTAWDFFHMRMLHLSDINPDIDHKTYLITQDKNIFSLFKSCNLEGAVTFSGTPSRSFVSSELKLHYKNDLASSVIEDVLEEFFVKRTTKKLLDGEFDIESVYRIKNELERDIQGLIMKDQLA